MPSVTRRRSPDAEQETWLIHYGDVQVGSISERAGVPADADPWSWSVGISPASHRGLHASGTAKSFDAARETFDAAWQWLLPKLTQADFTEWRRHHALDQWKRAMWDAGLKLPTQVADGRSTCFCGAAIGIADVEEHVFAAHMTADLSSGRALPDIISPRRVYLTHRAVCTFTDKPVRGFSRASAPCLSRCRLEAWEVRCAHALT